ncbi:MAG: TIGR03560 family F420-dependent LLM class oxidoreductase [Candidatus Rokubacteria bacterium]|nr:TIGR03560 family F420-dependent LLM class oxidoreductase [Candidatus Rokubacteria bacterium]
MRFGVFQGLTATTWEGVRELWRHLEATGWDAACVTDHFMPNTPDKVGDAMECWTTLAALAAVTPRMRVGTIVAGNTYRHPAVLAKMAAQVDIISGGRLICGLGAAWQQNEHEAYGIPFYTVGERLGRLDEACRVLKALWTRPKTTFAGRYYQLADAPLAPKPIQQPHPELMIGGGGEKVTLRIVARHADHWNSWGGPETLARKGRILDGYCAAIGRDPKAITRSANMPLAITEDPAEIERLKAVFMRRMDRTAEAAADTLLAGPPSALRDKLSRMREAGVDQVWIPTMFLPKDARPLLDRFMRYVAPALRY